MADMVDFSRFGFDPWEKYESNREYLLKRAGLEEAIRSGEEERELKSQELGLKAVEEARLGKKAKLEQINKQQETSMNKIGVLGSMLANANEENWGEIRKRGLQLLTQDLQMQLQSGIIDQNQFDEQVRFLDESVPEEYNQDFVLSTIRAFTDAGKDQEIETLWTKNKKTGAYTPHPHVSGTAITIPPGEVPVDDFDSEKVTTPWQAFFNKYPNATDEQIIDFNKRLKGLGEGVTRIKLPDGTYIETGGKQGGETQKAIGKEAGKGIGERFNKRTESGFEAYNQNFQLDLVKDAIAKGARTGIGEEALLNLRSLGQTFGINTGDLSGQELIRKVSNEMALRLRNPESGLGLTGNTSNKDLDFLKASVVGLGRTEAGNLLIIEAMKKLNQIKIDVAKKQQEIIRNNGGQIPVDIDDQVMKYVDGLTVLSEKERNEISRLSQRIVKRYKHKSGRIVVEFEDGSRSFEN